MAEYIRGADLKVGDKVSVWWQSAGARVLSMRPYTGKLGHLWPDENAQIIMFHAEVNRSGTCEMTVRDSDRFTVMP